MRISHRLYLTVLPSVLAVLLLAALTYWGQYEHTAPAVVLVAGAIAVVASLAITWTNARYVSRRIERLASKRAQRGTAEPVAQSAGEQLDELDTIEQVIGRLSSAVDIAEATRDGALNQQRRIHDYATLLVAIASGMADRLEEVRLPLHILLENRFGELNENQEEMLGAARVAAEAVDADVVQLRQLAMLDLGADGMRRDRLKISELIAAIRPTLVAAAEGAGATIEIEVEPLLPPVTGDRVRLQEALVRLCRGSIALASSGAKIRMEVIRRDGTIAILLHGGGHASMTVQKAVAIRLVQTQGGLVEDDEAGLRITLPSETGNAALSALGRPDGHDRSAGSGALLPDSA
jgi:signal transduction histidine kinase